MFLFFLGFSSAKRYAVWLLPRTDMKVTYLADEAVCLNLLILNEVSDNVIYRHSKYVDNVEKLPFQINFVVTDGIYLPK